MPRRSTLAALFDAFPEARFNIDLKAPSTVAPTVEVLELVAAKKVQVIPGVARPTTSPVLSTLSQGFSARCRAPPA